MDFYELNDQNLRSHHWFNFTNHKTSLAMFLFPTKQIIGSGEGSGASAIGGYVRKWLLLSQPPTWRSVKQTDKTCQSVNPSDTDAFGHRESEGEGLALALALA